MADEVLTTLCIAMVLRELTSDAHVVHDVLYTYDNEAGRTDADVEHPMHGSCKARRSRHQILADRSRHCG